MRWCYVSALTAALAGSGWGLAQTLPPVSADPVAPAKPAPPLALREPHRPKASRECRLVHLAQTYFPNPRSEHRGLATKMS